MEFLHNVYRITKARYADDLSGIGAFKVGGRWNSKGSQMLYTSSSISLSVLENLVHLTLHHVPSEMVIVKISIPTESIRFIEKESLADIWDKFPFDKYTQQVGDQWLLSQESLVLVVPSAVNIHEYNYLINPHHPKFKEIKIEEILPFDFDSRLVSK
jgi:RES domain-containing protein